MVFSIIVPVYNVEKYLNECIKSIINQTGIEFELILVNDGSTDRSGIICDEYAEKHSEIKVIHKSNGGLSDARNAGVKIANGEYILFVDGDDYIAVDSLNAIADTIIKEKKPNIIALELTKFFENSNKTIKMSDGIDEEINKLYGNELYEYLSVLPKYPASACTKAIQRTLFIDYDLNFVKGLLSEDLEWCIRLFLYAKSFAYCSHDYYFYRQARKDSISNTPSEKKVMDILETFQKWTEYTFTLSNFAQKRMICSYMEYIFRLLVLGYKNIAGHKRRDFRNKLKMYNYVLGYRKDTTSIMIRAVYKIFGIRITGVLLTKYLKYRDC